MSGTQTDIQWYLARDGKQHGPVSDVELRKLIEFSHLKPNDLIWRQGFSDWRTAASVFPAISEKTAPAPAPPVTVPKPAAATAPEPALRTQGSAASAKPMMAATQTAPAQQKPASQQPAEQRVSPQPQPFAPKPMGPVGAAQEARKGLGDFRPDQFATRPLGTPTRPDGPFVPQPAPGPRTTTDSRKPSEMMVPQRDEPAPPRGGSRKALVFLGLLAMTGAGAWISSRYNEQILAFVQTQSGGAQSAGEAATANAMPPQAPAQAAPAAPPETAATAAPVVAAVAAVSPDEIDRNLQGRTTWVSIKQEFPDWYQQRVTEVVRLTAEQKGQAEINKYLVTEFVQLRRENAKYALAASTTRHKEVAAAFLANLRELSQESGEGCYDFISRGEVSPAFVARLEDPAKRADSEAQMVAIVSAIAEGRKQPAEHAPPVKTDYDVLAGELGRLGWTQADMQLFANPRELAKAPRDRVCNMLKDWFTAHLAIQDPSTQERLLYETLKPVVSG